VDHQVEHDIHIERARAEDAETVHLEEHRLGEQWECSANGRVKALEVSHLRDALVFLRQ
jgi:hypothetical protein